MDGHTHTHTHTHARTHAHTHTHIQWLQTQLLAHLHQAPLKVCHEHEVLLELVLVADGP